MDPFGTGTKWNGLYSPEISTYRKPEGPFTACANQQRLFLNRVEERIVSFDAFPKTVAVGLLILRVMGWPLDRLTFMPTTEGYKLNQRDMSDPINYPFNYARAKRNKYSSYDAMFWDMTTAEYEAALNVPFSEYPVSCQLSYDPEIYSPVPARIIDLFWNWTPGTSYTVGMKRMLNPTSWGVQPYTKGTDPYFEKTSSFDFNELSSKNPTNFPPSPITFKEFGIMGKFGSPNFLNPRLL